MKPRRLGRFLSFYACTGCLYSGIAWGQNTNSAEVTGTVTDPSGAVVPGVTVTIHDVDKNTDKTVVASGAGVYDSGPLIPADHYTLSFTKQGLPSLNADPWC
jgi:hypothetical protein